MKAAEANKKGAAMLWAVLSVLMITLVTAGIVFISRTYYVRERTESQKMQAELYAQSAINLIIHDIETNNENSSYVSDNNTTQTVTVEFPGADNWSCVVAINHSLVNTYDESADKSAIAKKSGEIYLTAKVTRQSGSAGKVIELAEVCAKLSYNGTKWESEGYYNL